MAKSYDMEEFRKKYPHLYEELVKSDKALKLKVSIDPWRGYIPTPVDYIRRCKTVEEALEVLDYLFKNNEITREAYEEYKHVLMSEGLGFFGERKEGDYYYKEARRRIEAMRKKTSNA